MKYDIQINPLNPVEYLACCGVFEILSRFDRTALTHWELEPQPRFWIESEIDEASLLKCLTQTFSDWNQWQKQAEQNDEVLLSKEGEQLLAEDSEEIEEDADSEESDGNDGVRLNPQFSLNDKTIPLPLDWWYETLNPAKKIKAKSAWKMYAGQQTAEKISRDMTIVAATLLQKNPVTHISDLIKLADGMTGRFGFDPRSSRNALDTGYSPNDLNLPIATYPFAELLTTIAAQHFFPTRNIQGGGITSSRGWIEKNLFQYALWKTQLPVQLARMAAMGAALNKETLIPIQAERANRDKYSNFKMATMTTWPDQQSGTAKK